jgi:hypothetical protein
MSFAHEFFLFSVIPHPGKPGSACRKIKNRQSANRRTDGSDMVCGERGITSVAGDPLLEILQQTIQARMQSMLFCFHLSSS